MVSAIKVDAKLCRLLTELTFPLVGSTLNSDVRVEKQLCTGALKAHTDGDALVGNSPERIAVACSSGVSKAVIHMNENRDRKRVYCVCNAK